MKRFTTTSLFIAVLSAALFSACKSSDSGNSGADTSAASASQGQTGGAAPAAKGLSSAANAIGQVTAVSGTPLPQGYDVDYTGGEHSAPVFSWKDGAGKMASLEDYRGKVVMVNFWGTWCPPCRRELPDIVRLRDSLGAKGFEVIGVAVGERPPAGTPVEEHLAAFAGNNNLHYPLVIGNSEIVTHYGGIAAVPTTFIINKEGKVVNMLVGGMTEDRFRQAVEAAM